MAEDIISSSEWYVDENTGLPVRKLVERFSKQFDAPVSSHSFDVSREHVPLIAQNLDLAVKKNSGKHIQYFLKYFFIFFI